MKKVQIKLKMNTENIKMKANISISIILKQHRCTPVVKQKGNFKTCKNVFVQLSSHPHPPPTPIIHWGSDGGPSDGGLCCMFTGV